MVIGSSEGREARDAVTAAVSASNIEQTMTDLRCLWDDDEEDAASTSAVEATEAETVPALLDGVASAPVGGRERTASEIARLPGSLPLRRLRSADGAGAPQRGRMGSGRGQIGSGAVGVGGERVYQRRRVGSGGVYAGAAVPAAYQQGPGVRPMADRGAAAGRRRGREIVAQLLAAAMIASAGVYVGMMISAVVDENAEPSLKPVASSGGGVAGDGSAAVDWSESPIRSAEDGSAPAPAPVTAGPADGGSANTDEVEPVVYVAASVIPSVVRVSTGVGQGSGIVWDEAEGHIVTNYHVLRSPLGGEMVDTVEVTFADGTRLQGEVLGGSVNQDVAVVSVDPGEASLVAAEFAPTKSVQVGQLAVAVGSPFDLTGTVTSGIVSSIRINRYGGADPSVPVPVEMIQTDAPINPGNSGGALADRQGRVIGMNTSIQTAGAMGNVGVGFAVPSDTVELIAHRIVKGESLDLGFLGISSEVGILDTEGVLITTVVDGSPADDAGVRVGDVVVAFQDKRVNDIAELSAVVKLYRPGDEVNLTIQRDSDLFSVGIVLESYEASFSR